MALVDTNRLRGLIAERGFSQVRLAKKLGMHEKTFYEKMRRGKFDSDEMYDMISILDIVKPEEIFFAPDVTQQVTKE